MDFTTLALSILLFVVYFCFVSVLLYSKDKEEDAVELKSQQSFSYKEAFSSEYDPEPEVAIEMPSPSHSGFQLNRLK